MNGGTEDEPSGFGNSLPKPTSRAMSPDVLERLRSLAPSGLQIPPPVFTEMGAEIVGYEEGTALTVRFPFDERFTNPLGVMQGGMIGAAIDNTIGPLSFLVAPPSVTTQFNLTFLRPIKPALDHFLVEGRLTEKTRQYLFFEARVTDPEGTTLALAQATCYILSKQGDGN